MKGVKPIIYAVILGFAAGAILTYLFVQDGIIDLMCENAELKGERKATQATLAKLPAAVPEIKRISGFA